MGRTSLTTGPATYVMQRHLLPPTVPTSNPKACTSPVAWVSPKSSNKSATISADAAKAAFAETLAQTLDEYEAALMAKLESIAWVPPWFSEIEVVSFPETGMVITDVATGRDMRYSEIEDRLYVNTATPGAEK